MYYHWVKWQVLTGKQNLNTETLGLAFSAAVKLEQIGQRGEKHYKYYLYEEL